jgi:hypothetical protein
VLLALRWRTPLVSGYRKLEGEAGGAPPLVVAVALHAGDGGRALLRVAVRDGYDVLGASTPYEPGTGAEEALNALEDTELGELPAAVRDAVRGQVGEVLARAAG